MRNGGGRTVVALAAGALVSGCAGAPPPERPKPAATTTVVQAPAPTATVTAEVEAPPIPIGQGFVADPDEPLPKGAVLRCGTGKMKVASPLAMTVTESGQIWALDSAPSGWALRDVNRGVDVAIVPGFQEAVFTPDASTLVTWQSGDATKLLLYSVAEKKVRATIVLPKIKEKKSGKISTAAEFGFIGLVGGGGAPPLTLHVAPDGKAVAAVTLDGQVHLVDVATGTLVKSHKLPKNYHFTGISNGGDRGLIEITDGGGALGGTWRRLRGLVLLDLRTGATVRKDTFRQMTRSPGEEPYFEHQHARVRIDAGGKNLIWKEGDFVTLEDVATGSGVGRANVTRRAEEPRRESLSLSQNVIAGGVVSGSALGRPVRDTDLRVLGPRTVIADDEIVDLITFAVTPNVKDFAAMSAGGGHHITETGGKVRLFPKDIDVPNRLQGRVSDVAFTSDNRLLVAESRAILHHPGTCAASSSLQEETARVTTGDHGVIAMSNRFDIGAMLGDKAVDRPKAGRYINDLAISLDGERLYASTEDGALMLLEAEGKYAPSLKTKFTVPLSSIAISRDGTLLAASTGKSYDPKSDDVWLFDLPKVERVAQRGSGVRGDVHFAGASVVLGAPHTGIKSYSVQGLRERMTIHARDCCDRIAVSPDGARVAGTTAYGLRVWDLETRRLVAHVDNGHRERVRAVAFSPDGKFIATGSDDSTVVVWQLDKLSAPSLQEKTETVASSAADSDRTFASRSHVYMIAPDGKLALRPGKKDTLPPLKSVTAVVSTYWSHCAIAESKVRCWGLTTGGVLGVPEKQDAARMVATEITSPTTLKVKDPVAIQMRGDYACALSRSGSLWCWGSLDRGDPGVAPKERFSGVRSFDLGVTQRCAVFTTGETRCWEQDPQKTDYYNTFEADSVTTGEDHACALTRKGALLCRGVNDDDQLGDETGLDHEDFLPVKGLSQVTTYAADRLGACAVTSDLHARCWGAVGGARLERPTQVKSLDGATALRLEYDRVCGRIGDRVDCVTLSWEK